MVYSGSWYPLSHGQEALWFLWKLAPQSWAYNIVLPVVVRGDFHFSDFHRSLQIISDRHPCLRTEFREENGHPVQRVRDQHPISLERIDASSWSEDHLQDTLRESARRPFDLEASASPRATLFHRTDDRHVFLLAVHHIVSDLWSLIVLMDELKELYAAARAGTECDLPPQTLSFEDYVRDQRQQLEGEAGEQLWRYWRDELTGELPILDLPTDRQRPPKQSFLGGTVVRRLDADLTRQLKQLAGAEGATLFMALLTAYQVLLHRYSGQESIMVGSPTSGRDRAELGGLVGDFVNMVPLLGDLAGEPSFRHLLKQVRSKVVGAISYQSYPFSLLVDRLQSQRDLSRSPIFQTTFVLQKFHRFEELSRMMLPGEDEPAIPFADLELVPLPLAQQDGQFDLNLEMKEDDSGRLVGAWKYAADLFEADTIDRLSSLFETLLREIIAHPGIPVAKLSLLTPEENHQAIASGQGAAVELPATASSVGELFEAQAEQRGGEIAVSCEEISVTYSELADNVERLARRLVNIGVSPDMLVAVLLPRGLDFVTLLLAISKAGGAFLPLDPRHPPDRLRKILERSGAPLVLTTGDFETDAERMFEELATERRPRIVTTRDLAREQPAEALPSLDGRNLAYVMYTSGSTGQPKGVMVEHRGMVNHVLGKLSDLGMGPGDTLAQNGPQSFDIVVWQCLAPLVVGGRVAVFPDEIAEDPSALIAEVEKRQVSALQLVPSMLHALIEEATTREQGTPTLPSLRWMVPTGDALPTELCRRWLEIYPAIPVLNTYGSTECSDDQCHYRLSQVAPADEAVAVTSIGTPIHNLTAFVLDDSLACVPIGVVGELYIGGLGVGRGYRQDPARTAAAFLPDPISQRPGMRLYRTRDLARRRIDDNLDFLSRVDHMIKLRGFRIEPGEIETALCRHAAISEAAVLARNHPNGERRLVAYLVPSEPVSGESPAPPPADDLRLFLAGSLPQYMIPEVFHFLDSLPLTANGKLDQRALPTPEWQAATVAVLVAPRTPTEKTLARIWRQVLRLDRVGVTDDLFAIGGDSILSIQIVARCKQAGLHFQPSDLFLHRTIATLAAQADADSSASLAQDEPAPRSVMPSLDISQKHLELAFGQVEFGEE